MYILQVVPITKSIDTELLTYFSAKKAPMGSLVTVPLRKKEIIAIVIQTESVVNMKTQLRGASYQIRNVRTVHETQIFSPAFLRMAETIKNFYAETSGRIIGQIIPSFILKNLEEWSTSIRNEQTKNTYNQLLLQRSRIDRISYFKTLIRESRVSKDSLHIICPTVQSCDDLYHHIQKNNDHVFVMHSKTPKRRIKEDYEKVTSSQSPTVVISTPGFIDTKQYNLSTIIIEQESSRHYFFFKLVATADVVIQNYAKESGCTLVWSDTILRPETYYLHSNTGAELIEPFTTKVFKKNDLVVINQHETNPNKISDTERIKEIEKKNTFQILHPQTIEYITKGIKKNEKIFLFVHKKSLAPNISCNDCGNLARSPDSGIPYALYERRNSKTSERERIYICSMTGESIPAFDTCQFCNSWNMVQLGIGVQRVHDELVKMFPNVAARILDNDHTKTQKQLRELLSEYSHTNESMIVIGTQKAVSYLPDYDRAIIVSMDSYFNRMSYNTHPEVLNLVAAIAENSEQGIILQSRNVTIETLPILDNGLYMPYIKNELALRQEFGYSPFQTTCVIKKTVSKNDAKKTYQFLAKELVDFEPDIISHPTTKKTMVQIVAIMRLSSEQWSENYQDPKLNSILTGFDRRTDILFNPQTIL